MYNITIALSIDLGSFIVNSAGLKHLANKDLAPDLLTDDNFDDSLAAAVLPHPSSQISCVFWYRDLKVLGDHNFFCTHCI